MKTIEQLLQHQSDEQIEIAMSDLVHVIMSRCAEGRATGILEKLVEGLRLELTRRDTRWTVERMIQREDLRLTNALKSGLMAHD